MGIAAYNRGSAVLSRQIDAEQRSLTSLLIDDLNAMPKHANARTPFGPVLFKYDGQRWWALDPVKQWRGFGFWYSSLRAAVASFNVTLVEHNATEQSFLGVINSAVRS